MEKEKYEVFNPGNTNISLTVKAITKISPVVEIASHHRRRLNRGTTLDVSIPSQHSVDLVEKTGFSIADLQMNVELQTYIRNKRLVHVIPENQEKLVITEYKKEEDPENPDTDKVTLEDDILEDFLTASNSEEVPVVEAPVVEVPVVMTSSEKIEVTEITLGDKVYDKTTLELKEPYTKKSTSTRKKPGRKKKS